LGDGDGAFDLYRRNCPAYLEDKSEIHRTEPYVYSQMIAGREAPRYGEAKNSWLTGTASWTMVAASQAILGLYADYDGLCIRPCLPKHMTGYTAVRKLRGCTYDITVKNTNGTAAPKYFVDGVERFSPVIPVSPGKTVHVTVTL
jgi:cellobiose phosphorylase